MAIVKSQESFPSPAIAQALYELVEESEIWSPYYPCIPVPFSSTELETWISGTRRFAEGDMQKFILLAIAQGIIVPGSKVGTYMFR